MPPAIPVSAASSAWRFSGNQFWTRRRTFTNVTASPTPTSARPATATGSACARANIVSPTTIARTPRASVRRGPIRSAANPAGSCIARYAPICRNAKSPSAPVATPRRSAVSPAATLRVTRWKNAMRYALTPTPHTTHARAL